MTLHDGANTPNGMPDARGGASAGRAHRVVIVGGGFGGLAAARGLAGREGIDVVLVDKRNFHLFQPLLYQVATGALSPGDVAAPLREALRRAANVTVLLGEVTDVDVQAREVVLGDAMGGQSPDRRLAYDTLIVAPGMISNYFGHGQWERLAPGLKSIEDATEVRSRILLAFEEAERTTDPAARSGLLTFVIVGGGPTGVEVAGAITEFARDTLPVEFRRIAGEKIHVILIDGGHRVLAAFVEPLSAAALSDLQKMGVDVRLQTTVKDVDASGVSIEHAAGDGGVPVREKIDARVVVWAAGVHGTPLGARLAEITEAKLNRQGALAVEEDLSLPGHEEILVLGDAASFAKNLAEPLPGVAQVAIQQGHYAAELVRARLRGEKAVPFHYADRGSMATIGRAKAVADLKFLQLSGFLAWVAWLFVHLLTLVGYENRVLVLTQWAWYYVWRRRSARLITAWQVGAKRPPSLDQT
ncbi:MAG TPA: NAD(P)/FAD-dependent oxidoreductase [Candidatus Binatia bacterium]|jgi:NADH dehydrogenase